jgi:putative NIF3 family GTP cyclohydrolase 1 type 2
MGCKVKEIVKVIETIAPPDLAEEWDNSGLLLGDPEAPVKRIMTAMDATEEVVGEAVDKKVDMICTHHPVMFKPIRSVTAATAEVRLLLGLLGSGKVKGSQYNSQKA